MGSGSPSPVQSQMAPSCSKSLADGMRQPRSLVSDLRTFGRNVNDEAGGVVDPTVVRTSELIFLTTTFGKLRASVRTPVFESAGIARIVSKKSIMFSVKSAADDLTGAKFVGKACDVPMLNQFSILLTESLHGS